MFKHIKRRDREKRISRESLTKVEPQRSPPEVNELKRSRAILLIDSIND